MDAKQKVEKKQRETPKKKPAQQGEDKKPKASPKLDAFFNDAELLKELATLNNITTLLDVLNPLIDSKKKLSLGEITEKIYGVAFPAKLYIEGKEHANILLLKIGQTRSVKRQAKVQRLVNTWLTNLPQASDSTETKTTPTKSSKKKASPSNDEMQIQPNTSDSTETKTTPTKSSKKKASPSNDEMQIQPNTSDSTETKTTPTKSSKKKASPSNDEMQIPANTFVKPNGTAKVLFEVILDPKDSRELSEIEYNMRTLFGWVLVYLNDGDSEKLPVHTEWCVVWKFDIEELQNSLLANFSAHKGKTNLQLSEAVQELKNQEKLPGHKSPLRFWLNGAAVSISASFQPKQDHDEKLNTK